MSELLSESADRSIYIRQAYASRHKRASMCDVHARAPPFRYFLPAMPAGVGGALTARQVEVPRLASGSGDAGARTVMWK